jgi:hypothetical protein
MQGHPNRGLFCTHLENWRSALAQRKIKTWIVDADESMTSRTPALRVLL